GVTIEGEQVALAIDEFPAIFIAAACAEGTTILRNAEELRVKETDRIAAMAAGLTALGVDVEVFADGLAITGNPRGPGFTGARIDSRGDHRIAMAFAIAALRARAPITIDDCANVAASFPYFVALAVACGLDVSAVSEADAGRLRSLPWMAPAVPARARWRRRWRKSWAGRCSTAAHSTAWSAGRPNKRGCQRRMRRPSRRWPLRRT